MMEHEVDFILKSIEARAVDTIGAQQVEGVHAGIWAVVSELAAYDKATASIVFAQLQPDVSFMASTALETLERAFGGKREVAAWIRSFVKVPGIDYSCLCNAGEHSGEEVDRDAFFHEGYAYGVGEAYLSAMAGRARAVFLAMDAVSVGISSVHESTIARAKTTLHYYRFIQLIS